MPTRPSLALLTLLTLAGAAAADEVADARQALARFGGVVLARGEVHLEVTMGDDGVRIYPMDRQGAPAALYTMGGEVVIRAGEIVRRRLPLTFVFGSEGGPGHLAGVGDLTGVADDRYQLEFALTGFPDVADADLTGRLPFRRTPPHRP